MNPLVPLLGLPAVLGLGTGVLYRRFGQGPAALLRAALILALGGAVVGLMQGRAACGLPLTVALTDRHAACAGGAGPAGEVIGALVLTAIAVAAVVFTAVRALAALRGRAG